MASLQFRTWQTALDAFKNAEVEAWSIWDGKSLMYKGMGEEELESWLQLLEKNDTDATYTLRYYEDIDDKRKIKSSTPHDGSFNFKVNAPRFEDRRQQYDGQRNEIYSKVAALENTLGRIEARLDEPDEYEATDEKPNRLGLIGEVLGHPTIAALLPQILSVMMGTGKQATEPAARPMIGATVGNVPTPAKTPPNDPLAAAIDRLGSFDPRLVDHLNKLAEIAEKDPGTFNTVMAMLDGYTFKD